MEVRSGLCRLAVFALALSWPLPSAAQTDRDVDVVVQNNTMLDLTVSHQAAQLRPRDYSVRSGARMLGGSRDRVARIVGSGGLAGRLDLVLRHQRAPILTVRVVLQRGAYTFSVGDPTAPLDNERIKTASFTVAGVEYLVRTDWIRCARRVSRPPGERVDERNVRCRDQLEIALHPPVGRQAAFGGDGLRVLSLNTHLIPFRNDGGPVSGMRARRERAHAIGRALQGYDVVLLQEAFTDRVVRHLRRAAERDYPHAYFHSTTTSADSSGLGVLSRFPLEGTPLLTRFTHEGSLPDSLADKGFLHARVVKAGRRYHLVTTHLAAAGGAGTRGLQLGQLGRYLERSIPATETVVIGGDFNVAQDGPEYSGMLETLGVALPPRDPTGLPFTVDRRRNTRTGQGSAPRNIDYVFVRNTSPTVITRTELFRPRIPWRQGYWELSDHFPVSATVRFGDEIVGEGCYWSPTISEEQGIMACQPEETLSGLRCYGRRCDDKRLYCCPISALGAGGDPPVAASRWSGWFSEERPSEATADDGFVRGMRCRGDYCDNLQLQTRTGGPRPDVSSCSWTQEISEESGGDRRNRVRCPTGAAVTGVRCRGGHCDRLALRCCAASPCARRGPYSSSSGSLVELVRWHSARRDDHYLTADGEWQGCVGDSISAHDGYRLESLEGAIFSPSAPQPEGTVPLHTWFSSDRREHFSTTQQEWRPTGSAVQGYRHVRLEGYVYSPALPQPPGTSPLHSYWNASRSDNLTTSTPGAAPSGYSRFRLEGYVTRR